MSRYTWLLDPGHGGIIDGVYQTAGKRSPAFPDGSVLYEGEFNRAVVKELVNLCDSFGVDAINLVDTEEDIPLGQRVRKANQLHKEKGNCIYVSVHSNAYGGGKTFKDPKAKAKGTCTFHHYKSTSGKRLANVLQGHLAELTPFRSRGVRSNDTWANFYVLRKTHMPAVLSENGFMTNYDDAMLLMRPDVRREIAVAHWSMILEIEKDGL